MAYKAFADFYHEAEIRHLILTEYQGNIVSPPFATELCKNYSKVLIWNGTSVEYVELDLPPVTSKTNAVVTVQDSLWLIPYGIWDDFNIVVQLKDKTPIYHKIDNTGKGQFYSVATDGKSAFSFPLGYEDTSYGLYIKDNAVQAISFNKQEHVKLHMGCVFSNGRYWSMPRSDTAGYLNLVSFDGTALETYPVPNINSSVTRKYTDVVAVGDTLYALPFGETSGLNEVIEFNTNTKEFKSYALPGHDFAKKYNVATLVENKIIGVPYGDEFCYDSNLGIVFDVNTKEIKQFDIGIAHGGKYRYRSGISYKGSAFFFPGGSPSCPIIKVSQEGTVEKKLYFEDTMLGRPLLFKDKMYAISYNLKNKSQSILEFDEDLNYESVLDF